MEQVQHAEQSWKELRRGVIPLAVLLHLRRENHGYAVRQHLSNLGLPLQEGTLYPLLGRLEAQGALLSRWDCSGDRMRKYYLLTERGKHMLDSLRTQWRQLAQVIESIEDGDYATAGGVSGE
ncbi:MAG TPA: PadR family transcriptional regulator [Luteimonas sp.]|nr:PadR family transcriptional regulator [Luteimonas sp.]